MRLVRFGQYYFSGIDAEDMFEVVARNNLMPLTNGAFDRDGQGMYLEPRIFTHDFAIFDTAEQTIQEQMDALMAEVAKGRRILQAETRDGQFRQTFAKAILATNSYAPGNLGWQPLQIRFAVDYPYWLASDDEPPYFDDGWALDDALTLGDGQKETVTVDSTLETLTISNGGNVPFVRGRVVVEPGASASVTNLRLTNKTNGYWVQYTGTISQGDVLDIDFLAPACLLNYSPDYASLYYGSGQSSWMRLEPGDNDIEVTADSVSNSTTLYWWWSRHYL